MTTTTARTFPAARLDVDPATAGLSAVEQAMPYPPAQGDGVLRNSLRAHYGLAALAGYVEAVADDPDEPIRQTLGDVLADLRHLADALGLDFADVDRQAADRYREELHGEP